jgi:HAD superfamily hydrolase (TIGR01484 family)
MSLHHPLPLAALLDKPLQGLLGVMTDIDDTLTRDGAIEPAALQALADLRRAGVPVLAITGRPLGWSEAFAKAWPLDAIVAENGAVALIPSGTKLLVEYAQDEPTRQANRLQLEQVAAQILREVPGALMAQDSAGRATDIAIDHGEFTSLPAAAIAQVVALMQAAGMQATVSSIHINGWFGTHNKWTGALWMVQRLYQRPLQAEVARWLYVGDSTNDQQMFKHLPLSVGVANLIRFADVLHTWPAFITQAERGLGFAEVAARVVAARAGR